VPLRKIGKSVACFPQAMPKRWAALRAVVSLIPSTLLAYVSYSYLTEEPVEHQALRGFFEARSGRLLALAISPAVLSIVLDFWEWLGAFVRERSRNFFPSVQLTTTLAALNVIVGKKLDRFGKICRKILEERQDAETTFFDLTQPDEQIREIVQQVWVAVRKLLELEDLEVVLVEVRGGRLKEYNCYFPPALRPSETLLVTRGTFFQSIVRTGKFQAIPNVEKFLRRRAAEENRSKKRKRHHEPNYVATGGDAPASAGGSIVGIPIHHGHLEGVVYVMTFRTGEPDVLDKGFEKKFAEMLRVFTDRIVLEHSLKVVKNHVSKEA
jgi:hypothetical protein